MKRLILLLCLCLLVVPVLGIRENFQDYTHPDITNTITLAIDSTNNVYVGNSSAGAGIISTSTPVTFTYAALDTRCDSIAGSHPSQTFSLYDSSYNYMGSVNEVFSWPYLHRDEIKIIGGSPQLYVDGTLVFTGSVLSINPSYISGGCHNGAGFGVSNTWDNVAIGETDHHIVGALPSNWTIQRDLLNPSATGVYAWSGSAWVLKNSYDFYLDADKEYLDPENVVITDFATSTVVNTTTVTAVKNTIQYDVSQFLTTPTGLGSNLPDGRYSVSFDTAPAIYDTFWVISSGATLSWAQSVYSQGGTGVVNYAIAGSGYWDQSTYSYSMVTKNIYGTVMNTQTIPTQTGAISVPITTSYNPGVYYSEITATKISDGTVNVMNVAYMSVTTYITMNGFVMNEETGATIAAANLNVTQGFQTQTVTSGYNGNWSSNNWWVSGSPITINTTASGFKQNIHTFTPLTAAAVALNISMSPTTSSFVGVSIGGVVSDNQYGNPIPGATYHVLNSTESTTTTNIAGFARVDNLVNGNLYNVWSSKLGYGNSSVTQIVAVGT